MYDLNFSFKLCACLLFSPVPDYVKATVETVLKIHETEDDGDVLAFLTGQVSHSVQTFFNRPKRGIDVDFAFIVVSFCVGGSGESGVPPAGTGQDSVSIWHEETPQNIAHVLWSALR